MNTERFKLITNQYQELRVVVLGDYCLDRYLEIDPTRTEAALAWTAPHDFEAGLARTIDWYLAHRDWWQAVRARRYAGERLGTAA